MYFCVYKVFYVFDCYNLSCILFSYIIKSMKYLVEPTNLLLSGDESNKKRVIFNVVLSESRSKSYIARPSNSTHHGWKIIYPMPIFISDRSSTAKEQTCSNFIVEFIEGRSKI